MINLQQNQNNAELLKLNKKHFFVILPDYKDSTAIKK